MGKKDSFGERKSSKKTETYEKALEKSENKIVNIKPIITMEFILLLRELFC